MDKITVSSRSRRVTQPVYEGTILIKARPTPRPKVTKFGVYYPNQYGKYKEALAFLFAACIRRKKPDQVEGILDVTVYLPYPKRTPKRDLIEGTPHKKKPDADNYAKGIMDALEQIRAVHNDSVFYRVIATKYYTIREPRIEFKVL